MTQNMYRVGDYVYFECFPSAPYQIRRIEELNKTSSGAVEAKVVCFYRRRDLPETLLKIADQAERQSQILSRPRKTLLSIHKSAPSSNGDVNAISSENGDVECGQGNLKDSKDDDDATRIERSYGFAGLPLGANNLSTEQIHELRQHELFLSRQYDTLPATQIRGKCTVVILNEVETCEMYLGREDAYFYSLVYDPSNQTLLADKGKIEIGVRHQAIIPNFISEVSKNCDELSVEINTEEESTEKQFTIQLTGREHVVYHPYHDLTDRDIDQFLIIARAVGTFSRALDATSGIKLPSIHMTAAASRDVTLLHAMALLHLANYDIGQATKFLVPPPNKQFYPLDADRATSNNTVSLGGPILCRDQLEEWSAAEATLFEDAIEKYGKDFHSIRIDCLPWKSIRDIVEYYYMWKTTGRYADLQKSRATEDNKLKQIYIPSYNKPHTNQIGPQNTTQQPVNSNAPCEGCLTHESLQWYNWGPNNFQLRLCSNCWTVWKKHGGLKRPHEYELYDLDGSCDLSGAIRAPPLLSNLARPNVASLNRQLVQNRSNGQQTRVAINQSLNPKGHFYLQTALEARIARRMAPKNVFNVRKSARSPFKTIDGGRLKAYYFSRPLGEVLKTATLVKQRNLARCEIDHLTKLHQKRTLFGASNGGIHQQTTRRN